MVGASCSNGDSPDGPDVPVTPVGQTVFMFFPWSNSLLSDFRRTVEDMQTVVAQRSMKDERIMVFMATSEREAVLFELKKQNGRCLTDTLRRYSDRPFTSRQWLTSLFSKVMTLAPASRYGMVVGCHGLAWVPVQGQRNARKRLGSQERIDEEYNLYKEEKIDKEGDDLMHFEVQGPVTTRFIGGTYPETQIETTDLADAMADAGFHTEYILFDACYMSSVEVAYELKDVTHYLIASPTEVLSYGFPYTTMGKHLLGTPNYKCIVDSFISFYSSYNLPYGTVAVTDCTQLDALAAIAQQINVATAEPINAATAEPTNAASEGKLNTARSGKNVPNGVQIMDGYSPTLFYDLGHLMSLKDAGTVLTAAFAEQLGKTVPYKGHTDQYFTALKDAPVDIKHYSGLNTSQGSLNHMADRLSETAWYKATN
ncbi:MAG: clostripain-related cysteine peptidase [Prevotella sp.]|nr:clostripain-related cysteine peptidase [Prevotella sp.]